MNLTQIEGVLGTPLYPFADKEGNKFVGCFIQMSVDNHSASDAIIHLHSLVDDVQSLMSLGTPDLAQRCAQVADEKMPKRWCVSPTEKGVALYCENKMIHTVFVGSARKHWPKDFHVFVCIPITETSTEQLSAA